MHDPEVVSPPGSTVTAAVEPREPSPHDVGLDLASALSLPFRPPDWRWRIANAAATGRTSRYRLDSETTILAVELMLVRLKQSLSNFRRMPMVQAIELYEAGGPVCWKLQALLLADVSAAAIGERLKLHPAVVTLYEELFFDVRSRLTGSIWISRLFGTGPLFGFAERDLAGLWMWIAYRGGEEALDLAIAVTTGEGREKYREEDLDKAELFIESSRIPTQKKPLLVIRLNARIRAKSEGAHPSAYHNLQRRKPRAAGMTELTDKPIPTSAPACPVLADTPTPTTRSVEI